MNMEEELVKVKKDNYLLKSENVYLAKELEKEKKRTEDFINAMKVITKGII